MIASLVVLLPLISLVILLALPSKQSKYAALFLSIVEFLLSIGAWYIYNGDATAETLSKSVPWIRDIGASFSIAIDGLSLPLVLLNSALVPLIIYTTFNKDISKPKAFYSLILVMQAAMMGVFMAKDGMLFYVTWELALIPIYFICLVWGDDIKGKITFKFFIYTLFGSLFMLMALIYLYLQTPDHSFALSSLYAAGKQMNEIEQGCIFWGLLLAFGIKMPIFPFHTWQPDTYVAAPTAGTMLLSGIMLKMGVFGLIVWLIPMVPGAVAKYSDIAMTLCIISVVYASLMAMTRTRFKRMIAYSSIAHVGLIAAGVFAFNQAGVQGAMMQMIAHGLSVVGLFYINDIITGRLQTDDMTRMGGLRAMAPNLALLFLLITLGSIALPLTSGFVGEFMLLAGIFQYNMWIALCGGLTIIFGAVYMLRAYQSMMLGEENEMTTGFIDLKSREKLILGLLSVLIFIIGIYPSPLVNISEKAIKMLLGN